MNVFICENTIDGIFSGIYRAYESRYGHQNIKLTTSDLLDTYDLFCQYEEVPIDFSKSQKVANTLLQKLGNDAYFDLCQSISAHESPTEQQKNISKADAVYRTVVLALSLKDASRVLEYLGNPYVNRIFQLSRKTYYEAHHLLGFLRFSELENGILFSKIHPQNDVLVFLAAHFTDRLPLENFIIYDETRSLAAIHKSGHSYILAKAPDADHSFMHQFSQKEQEYRRLWLEFFHSIAIDARKNPTLQSQNIPKRFWNDTVELFSDSIK